MQNSKQRNMILSSHGLEHLLQKKQPFIVHTLCVQICRPIVFRRPNPYVKWTWASSCTLLSGACGHVKSGVMSVAAVFGAKSVSTPNLKYKRAVASHRNLPGIRSGQGPSVQPFIWMSHNLLRFRSNSWPSVATIVPFSLLSADGGPRPIAIANHSIAKR